jgi:hypothetical protein
VDAIRVPLDLDGFEVMDSEVVNGTLEAEVRSARARPVTTADHSTSPVTNAASAGSAIGRAAIRPCCYGTSGGSGAAIAAAPAGDLRITSHEYETALAVWARRLPSHRRAKERLSLVSPHALVEWRHDHLLDSQR